MSSALIPSSISIPQAPAFSSVKFKTIGQPPELLKRFSDPDNMPEYEDEQDNSMPVSRQSTPTPASGGVHNNEATDRTGRPSLLQALAGGDDIGMTVDTDTVMTPPPPPTTTSAQPQSRKSDPSVGGSGDSVGAANTTGPPETHSHPPSSYPQSSITEDHFSRSYSLSSNASNNVNLGHHKVSLTAHESQTQMQAKMQIDTRTQASDADTDKDPRPTPELVYPSGRIPHLPLLDTRGGSNDNGATTSTSNPTTTSNTDIIVLKNLLEERMASVKARASIQLNSDIGGAQAFQSYPDSHLSPQTIHELNPQANQSNISPHLHAQIESQTQGSSLFSAQTQPNIGVSPLTELSSTSLTNLASDNTTAQSSHPPQSQNQSSPNPGSPIDSVVDCARRLLDDVSIAHAQFRDHLARAQEEASTARTQAAVAREEAADASALLGESRARNALLNEENRKLKEEIARLKQRADGQDKLEREVGEVIKFGEDILRVVDELVRQKVEEANAGEQRERERDDMAVDDVQGAEEREVEEENKRIAQAQKLAQRQKDAELRLQREQHLLRQREQQENSQEEKRLEQQLEAEKAAAFVKQRAEVMKEKERANQENAMKIRAERERRAVSGGVIVSSSSEPVNNSHATKANDCSSNGSATHGGDSMVVTAPIPAKARSHNLSIPESSPATPTPSIFHNNRLRHPGFSAEGDKMGLRSPPMQRSPASRTINLRHLKADISRNHVKDPVSAVAEMKGTTDVQIKTEIKKEEEDMDVVVKVEVDEFVSSSRASELQLDCQAPPLLQASTSPSKLPSPSRSQPRTNNYTSVSNGSLPSLPPAVPSATLLQKEASMPLSHRAVSRSSSKHSTGSQPSDLALNQAEPYGNEPTTGLLQRPLNHQPQRRGSSPLGRDSGWHSNQASERPLAPPAELPDRRSRPYSPVSPERRMLPMRQRMDHYSPPRPPIYRRVTSDHYSPPTSSSTQHYSPPPSPPETRNTQSRKRPRPEANSNVGEDDLPVRRPRYEDPSYEDPIHERPPVESRHEYANTREWAGPSFPDPDYYTPESEAEQYPSRGRTRRTSGAERYRPEHDSEQYNYDQRHSNSVRSGNHDTYGTAAGSSTSYAAATIPSRMNTEDHPQNSLLARISDTPHPPPRGPQAHNRRTSIQNRGGGGRGAGHTIQTRGRGGSRGGPAESAGRHLVVRLGAPTLQERLS